MCLSVERWTRTIAGFSSPLLMPWEEPEESYVPRFNPTNSAPSKPVRQAFGALFIKRRLGPTDEETVKQILDNANMLFSLGFAAIAGKATFNPSMMVNFSERFSEEDLIKINKSFAVQGKAKGQEAVAPLPCRL